MKRIGFIDGRRVAGWHFPATATPGNGQVVDVTDPSVGASSVAAQTLRYRPTGNKTGNIYSVAKSIDVYPQGNTYILEGLSIYFDNPVGAGVFGKWWALDIYMQAIGAAATVSELAGITIGMNYTNPSTAVNSAFLRLYTHGAVPMPAAIRIAGSAVDALVFFQRCVTPVLNAPVGAVNSKKIRVRFGDGGDFFIPLYTT